MPRTNVWNSCNRVLDEKWREASLQSHRARVDSIQGVGGTDLPSPARVSIAKSASTTFKALPKSKSPAAKSRQAEIERENMKLIKKIVELQTKKPSVSGGTTSASIPAKRRQRPSSASATGGHRKAQACHVPAEYLPNPLTGLAPGGGLSVPTANAHVLYTRQSATMTHHFPEQNAIPRNFHPGLRSHSSATTQRTQVRLQDENKKLLQRILSSKTTFSRAKWQAEERERRKLIGNISRFSHLKKRHSSPSRSPDKLERPGTADGHRYEYAAGLHGTTSHHTLAIIDAHGAHIIRTGSPVTHLRQRPMSASTAQLRGSNAYFDSPTLMREDLNARDIDRRMRNLNVRDKDGEGEDEELGSR